MPAYQHSNSETVVWTLIVLAGMVVSVSSAVALSMRLDDWGLSNWWMLPCVLPFPVSLWIAVRRMRRAARERDAQLQLLLEADGFLVDLTPSEERRRTVFAPVGFLESHLDLSWGAERIRWLGLRLPGWLIVEHEYTMGSGGSTTTHTREIAVLSATHPTLRRAQLGDMPWVRCERANALYRFKMRKEQSFTTLGDAAFDAKWILFGHADTARAFLTPETIRTLAESPKGETWMIGYGYVCCAYRGALAPAQWQIMVQRMSGLME